MGSIFGAGSGASRFKFQAPLIQKEAFLDPESASFREAQRRRISRAEQRQAPTVSAATIDKAPQEQFRGRQLGLADVLRGVGTGQRAGVGQAFLRQQRDRDLSGLLAAQAAQRGGGAGAATRALFSQFGQQQLQANQQAALLAAQEAQAARAQEIGLLGGGRGQDIGLATSQAQLQQQAALANQLAQIRQQALNQQAIQAATGQLFAKQEADRQALIANQQALQQRALGEAGINLKAFEGAAGRAAGTFGRIMDIGQGLLSGALGLFTSDERLKTGIKPGKKPSEAFLRAISPKTYEYKEPEKDGRGKHLGFLAQDLEKAGPIGKSMVIDTPRGKMVHMGKGLGTMLASMSHLQKEIDAINQKIDNKTRKVGK